MAGVDTEAYLFDDELGSLCQDTHSAPRRLKINVEDRAVMGRGICGYIGYIGVSQNCTDMSFSSLSIL